MDESPPAYEAVPTLSHNFEVDLEYTVIYNHTYLLGAIARSEKKEIALFRRDSAAEGPDIRRYGTIAIKDFFGDLRRAANNLALVGVVTRLQHWISRFVKDLPGQQEFRKFDKRSRLLAEVDLLNTKLGEGPIPVTFFADLVTVRDSIIHGDSKATWEYPAKSRRRVAAHYTNSNGAVELTQQHLEEATDKAIKQVKWYDKRLQAAKTRHPY